MGMYLFGPDNDYRARCPIVIMVQKKHSLLKEKCTRHKERVGDATPPFDQVLPKALKPPKVPWFLDHELRFFRLPEGNFERYPMILV